MKANRVIARGGLVLKGAPRKESCVCTPVLRARRFRSNFIVALLPIVRILYPRRSKFRTCRFSSLRISVTEGEKGKFEKSC